MYSWVFNHPVLVAEICKHLDFSALLRFSATNRCARDVTNPLIEQIRLRVLRKYAYRWIALSDPTTPDVRRAPHSYPGPICGQYVEPKFQGLLALVARKYRDADGEERLNECGMVTTDVGLDVLGDTITIPRTYDIVADIGFEGFLQETVITVMEDCITLMEFTVGECSVRRSNANSIMWMHGDVERLCPPQLPMHPYEYRIRIDAPVAGNPKIHIRWIIAEPGIRGRLLVNNVYGRVARRFRMWNRAIGR